MNMENGSSSTPSVVPYTNGTATTIGPNKPSATGTQMANAVSMESLDSAISTTNGGGSGGSDPQAQVRTLFVSGLPMDVKPRELYLLFRAYPGYETSQLKLTPSSKNGASKMASTPVGFVTFATRQDADEVRKKLQGVRFDPEQAQTIRLELARSNTKVTKPSKQPSPPNHIVNAAVATANSSVMPALLPPPAPIFSNIAVAQLAAMQQQQQLAAAILLNQQHHDANSSNGTALAQQQQQLFAALEHQRHLSPLINQNGIGDSSAIQHQLAALTAVNANPTTLSALSHAQQAQAVQQLLQHQQNSTAAAAILGSAGTIPSTNTGNPQFAAVAALAAAQNHNHLVATSSAALANGFPGSGGTAAGGWQTTLGMNGQTTGPCSTIFIANLGPAATNSPQIVEEELKSLFGIFQGFSRIRMHTKSGAPVAFIEYAEVGQAVGAMMTMQGYCLAANGGSGPGGGTNGIRIEFAKTRMGDTSTAQQRTDGGGK